MTLNHAFEQLEQTLNQHKGAWRPNLFENSPEAVVMKHMLLHHSDNQPVENVDELLYLLLRVTSVSFRFNSILSSNLYRSIGAQFGSFFRMERLLIELELKGAIEQLPSINDSHPTNICWRTTRELLDAIKNDQPFDRTLYQVLMNQLWQNEDLEEEQLFELIDRFSHHPHIQKVKALQLNAADNIFLLYILEQHVDRRSAASLEDLFRGEIEPDHLRFNQKIKTSRLFTEGWIEYKFFEGVADTLLRLSRKGIEHFDLKPLRKMKRKPKRSHEEPGKDLDYFLDLIIERGGVQHLSPADLHWLEFYAKQV